MRGGLFCLFVCLCVFFVFVLVYCFGGVFFFFLGGVVLFVLFF